MSNTIRELPTVLIDGKRYFLDANLSEFRACDNPHVRIGFDDFDENYVEVGDNEFAKLQAEDE